MEWAALFKIFQSWGPSAISSVLVIVVIYLIRKIDINSKVEEQRAEKLRTDINKTLNSFGERLSQVEHGYVKREDFYRDLSGWKSEINRLSDLIIQQFMNFSQNIIQLLSQGNK